MQGEEIFKEHYARLNTEQKRAVDAIEGPVFVVAGPGTGKTQVLTLRIANILRITDTPPEAILALTFTEAAAAEMRKRLASIIGTRAYRIQIYTFHGFAESVISRFPDRFPRILGSQVATDVERAEIIDQALLETPVEHLRPYGDPLYYHSIVTRAISTMKRENVSPDELESRIQEAEKEFESREGKVHEKGKYAGMMKKDAQADQRRIEKTKDLLAIYRAYEDGLAAIKRYDFDDLILEVVRALRNDANFLLEVQESVHYILADEHQDANRAQNALLELAASFHERPNLFVVGDEKQAIYRFQGADLDTMHYFRSRFPDTEILTLVDNYRSTQSILDSALALISASPDTRLSRASLLARSEAPARPLTLISCPTQDAELMELAANIRAAIEAGTRPGDIAVLLRKNRDVAQVAGELARAGIAVTSAGEANALHNRFVEALLRLLQAVAEPLDTNLAGVLTLPGFGLPVADVWRVTHAARKDRISILSALRDSSFLAQNGVKRVEDALTLAKGIEELVRIAALERPAVVAEEALLMSGLLPRLLAAPDRAASLAAVRALMHTFEDLSRREHGALLPRALEVVRIMDERGISLSGHVPEDETRVKVMTVHASKGREFAQVFIPFATDRSWSTRSRGEHFHLPDILSGSAELEDERRLLYVAITRAKQHATISYAASTPDGRTLAPSELISDLNPELFEERTPSQEVADPLERLIDRPRAGTSISEDDRTTLRAAFFAQGLSPTALNNYLECPWKYFYINLLRIPEAENKFMLYGTAIHEALRRYADGRTQGEDIGVEGLLAAFNRMLARSPLSERELTELLEKGTRALTIWWEERHDEWPSGARAEQKVEAYLELADEKLLLRGALDLMVASQGGTVVTDYKTGKPKSRNELMGKTKSGDGNYFRQLSFYALLIKWSEIEPKLPPMHEGVIEFVEPDDAGRIRRESFEMAESDIQELEAAIRAVSHDILGLSFWNARCDQEECSWCRLRFQG